MPHIQAISFKDIQYTHNLHISMVEYGDLHEFWVLVKHIYSNEMHISKLEFEMLSLALEKCDNTFSYYQMTKILHDELMHRHVWSCKHPFHVLFGMLLWI